MAVFAHLKICCAEEELLKMVEIFGKNGKPIALLFGENGCFWAPEDLLCRRRIAEMSRFW